MHKGTKFKILDFLIVELQVLLFIFMIGFMLFICASTQTKYFKNSVFSYLMKINWSFTLVYMLCSFLLILGLRTFVGLVYTKTLIQSHNDFHFQLACCLIASMLLTMNTSQFEIVGSIISFLFIFNRFMPKYLSNQIYRIDNKILDKFVWIDNNSKKDQHTDKVNH